mmetsp:Transcript_38039/g.104636  ORF Transcript_38039/g.104636 Transcript_38039/m.104636 type:complete len:166 (+) Transcript_38039:74-571(+)
MQEDEVSKHRRHLRMLAAIQETTPVELLTLLSRSQQRELAARFGQGEAPIVGVAAAERPPRKSAPPLGSNTSMGGAIAHAALPRSTVRAGTPTVPGAAAVSGSTLTTPGTFALSGYPISTVASAVPQAAAATTGIEQKDPADNDIHRKYAKWRLRYGEAPRFLYL